METDDDDARRAWFRREILPLEPELRAFLRRAAPRDIDIDDLVHDALVRVIATPGWRDVGSPSAFLRTTARNLVYDILRKRQVVSLDYVADLESVDFRCPDPDAEATAIGRQELRILTKLVGTLPPQCRRVFTLRKIHGLTPTEIAVRLGLSVSTVEKHLVKSLRICSEGLARLNRDEDSRTDAARRKIHPRTNRSGGG